jgi:hypothetical protein
MPVNQAGRRAARALAALILGGALLGGCGGGSPVAPAFVLGAHPPPAASTPPRLPATLEISRFVVRSVPTTRGNAAHHVTLQISETSGLGGADLYAITLTDPTGNSETGCGGRVAPGATWDMDVDSAGYCTPEVPTNADVPAVSVIVEFVADDGTRGALKKTVETTR